MQQTDDIHDKHLLYHFYSLNDQALFLLIANGDEAAFRIFFDRYVPKIRPVIRAIVREELPVKDLIQDVFLLLWISREKLSEVRSPESWIFKIAHHESYKWLRKQGIIQRANDRLSGNKTPAHANTTEVYSQFEETTKLLRSAINNLPPQAKKVYQMRREIDMSIDEVAAALNLAPKTVKNTLTRALQSIRDFLEQHGVVVPIFILFYFL